MDHPAAAEGTPAHCEAHCAAHCAAHSEGVLDGEIVGLPASGHLGRPSTGGVADPPPDDAPDDAPDLLADPPADSPAHARTLSQRRPHAQSFSRRRSFA
ncbi:hypothetical protein AAH991_07055 [Microbispora sp. ZYX-F-249]|uniref:Uncharacterized protein n=1 Tax=Microbispora maris TaxID=3144104 RepID=A0ABV0AJ52_9ACTN